jgi:predicted HTH domain antitoxin
MKNLTLTYPDDLNLDEREIRRFLAAKLYESGKLSLGQAADLAGMSKMTFAEILADYQVELIQYSAADIARDADKF